MQLLLLGILSLILLSTPLRAQTNVSSAEHADSVLIRNVHLLSQEDTANLKISLIILDGKLELVTRDDIKAAPGAKVYDGKGGFLMGRVIIGEPPSFVVLKENPRENFDIFLNTKDYVIFAMEDGAIVNNALDEVSLEPEEEKEQGRRFAWTAYNPPPMAVPFNYYSSRKWNRFETKYISGLFNGIIALDRMVWLSQNQNSHSQVGKLSESSLGEIRAIRFGLIGTFNFKRPWVYTVFITNNTFDRDYTESGNRLTLYDLRVDIPLPSGVTLSVGKQKEPISLSRLTTLVFLPMQERQAAEDAFLPARNWGAVLNSMYLKGRGTWAVGVFKNLEGDTTFRDTPMQLTGRITGVPLVTEDQSNLLHMGLGIRYSDAKQPVVAKTESEFYLSPVFVRTPEMQAGHFFTNDFELYWRKGPLLVGGEYITNSVSAPDLGNPDLYGFNLGGTWAVTGEMRPYRKRSGIFDPLPVSKPVGQGGFGALELAFRYSLLDLNNAEIQGGKMRTTSAGLTWWPSPRAQLGWNYRFISLDRDDIVGKSSGMNLRLMLILD
ncbi:hypothetical protein J0A68_06335 [Algoriphagus sp. H41]|uniref:Porin n=1 Tax=Algoriphagus oliviformis TaxID=2811231 RepID=A0ABS3C341_9BACT|nr:porin [Algoriphagus oliviformis]MBN7810565.1 hypothetical protein [Algoriphagus oliviformis]